MMNLKSRISLKRENDFFQKLFAGEGSLNPISIIAVPYSGKTEFVSHICRKDTYLKHYKSDIYKLILIHVNIHEEVSPHEFYDRIINASQEISGVPYEYPKPGYKECFQYLQKLSDNNFLTALVVNKFEILACSSKTDDSFFRELRTFATDIYPIGSVVWVTTSVKPLSELLKKKCSPLGSSLANIFSYYIYLGFGRDEIFRLLTETSEEMGERIEAEAIYRFIDCFGRIPNLLPILFQEMVRLWKSDSGNCIERCKLECNQQLYERFNKIWNSLDIEDRQLLLNIDKARNLEIPWLNYKLTALENYGIIDAINGGFKISSSAFAKWIQENCSDVGRIANGESAVSDRLNPGVPLISEYAKETNEKSLNILHISDIHGTDRDNRDYVRLLFDLRDSQNIQKLDYLVITGDITNKAGNDEFDAGMKLVKSIINDFKLGENGRRGDHVIIVPGNHDLDWNMADKAYSFAPGNMITNDAMWDIPVRYEDNLIGNLLCDKEAAKSKYANFISFYRSVTGRAYPREFDKQAYIVKNPIDRILFLCLNSSWKMDRYHSDSRITAEINQSAFSDAVKKLSDDYSEWLKIVVLHHPIIGKNGVNPDFLELLSQKGFKIIMHGHIHESQHNVSFYTPWNSNMHSIGAGTFGAPANHMTPGIPLQYNLIKYYPASNKIIVHTRKKERRDGAWVNDNRWPIPGQVSNVKGQAFYEFTL